VRIVHAPAAADLLAEDDDVDASFGGPGIAREAERDMVAAARKQQDRARLDVLRKALRDRGLLKEAQ
jgi:hypothetical protein